LRTAPPPAALLTLFRRRADKQITIQQPTVVNNITKFVDWVTVNAALDPQSGVERSGALDPSNVVTTSVYIEYLAGVRPKMRINLAGRILEIISVINLTEANLILHLVTKEAVS
jgi:SPP1 family predicted phage head-tail adaptor